MKFFSGELGAIYANAATRRNLRVVLGFVLILTVMVLTFSAAFHALMAAEGRSYSFVTGLYWTLTVMSTLGFGDITFGSDLGKLFSIAVLLSGTLFLLIILPFVFIQFFWTPWMEAQARARAPRELPPETTGHVLLGPDGPVTRAFIERLERFDVPYRLVVETIEDALRLHDEGISVLLGNMGDPLLWKRARVERSILVALAGSDYANTNAAFTVRGLTADVPIIALASDPASIDVLELAGSNWVLHLANLLGQGLARRTLGGDAATQRIGRLDSFGGLEVAEAAVTHTPLVGKTLRETNLRKKTGLNVVGLWERGLFRAADPDIVLTDQMVLVLVGTGEQLELYDELFVIFSATDRPVVILGGGRVGRATAAALAERGLDYRIVEKLPERARGCEAAKFIFGSAADLETLEQAGIKEAPAVIITTGDDDLNVYLTIYCRKLRPDVQIITRASLERNVETLHRAGTDFVLSYASMGATSMLNVLKKNEVLMLAEGLDLFRMRVPEHLAGKTIADSEIRQRTGATVVALSSGEDVVLNPPPTTLLPEGAQVVLIGSTEAQERFCDRFVDHREARR